MKKLLFAIFIFVAVNSFSNTYTSVGNGAWFTPTTWSPSGIPQAADTVIINNTITLANDWQITGMVTINQAGILQEDQAGRTFVIQSAGKLINNGSFIYSKFVLYSGMFTNNGTSTIDYYIYANSTILNYGNINNADSIYTSGTFNNYSNGYIESDSIFNAGTFTNDGELTVTDMYNDSVFVNNGTFEFNRFYNNSYFVNNYQINSTFDATNAGYWLNSTQATIDLDHCFTNGDTLASTHEAVFINDGIFNIGDSWHNADSTKGSSTGSFVIQNGTYNTGVMIGEFDFCDQSQIVSTPPFIDYNIGYIDTNITYCTVGIKNNNISNDIKLYPNPSSDFIFIETNSNINDEICFYNILGTLVYKQKTSYTDNNKYQVNIKELKTGVYFIKIQNKNIKFIKI